MNSDLPQDSAADPGAGEPADRATVDLGEVDPRGSRHAGRQSAVAVAESIAFVGTSSGTVRAVDATSGEQQWTAGAGDAALVSAVPLGGGVAVGERGPAGEVRLHGSDGHVRWRYRTADDVGEATKDTRFFLPFVADLAADGEAVYAAARRYERGRDGSRTFESVVYAFEAGGGVRWRYRTDASPISLDVSDGRVAVGYNRCPGDHQRGLVVLDAGTGEERGSWDPGNDGQRRVGDVSLLDDGLAVTSHGDYRGYRLDADCEPAWAADLATETRVGEETLYAYPNHVHATDAGVCFVTGNTYPEEGRETESRHPDEHTAFGYAPDGKRRWTAPVSGFASGIGTDGDRVAVPVAQNFRERDAAVHGCRTVDVREGEQSGFGTAGVATAAALAGGTLAVVEEPVVYHDEGERRGAYRLHLR